jgi:hypothetical protein
MRGVPWLTHVGVMLAFTLWWYLTTLAQYGVDSSTGWWDPELHRAAAVLVSGVVVFLGVPLAWTEAWAVQQRQRWGAHLLAGVYVVMAGLVAHVLAEFRLAGDDSPTLLVDLTFAWATYPVMVGLQLLLVRWMVRWRFPTTKRGAGRRWAKKLGLVE